jgi:hypothetical protein
LQNSLPGTWGNREDNSVTKQGSSHPVDVKCMDRKLV